MLFPSRSFCAPLLILIFFVMAVSFIPLPTLAQTERHVPDHVPPKRSSQIQDGFGINSDLPREPYLPWDRWWWTRMFDAGFKWIRIGQYENSSDYTSWIGLSRSGASTLHHLYSRMPSIPS